MTCTEPLCGSSINDASPKPEFSRVVILASGNPHFQTAATRLYPRESCANEEAKKLQLPSTLSAMGSPYNDVRLVIEA